jgi:hypothetical protein
MRSIVAPAWKMALLNTRERRKKVANMQRDSRVLLTIHNHENPYNWVQVRGQASLSTQGATDHLHRLSRKYFGRNYPFEDDAMNRLIVSIEPQVVLYGEQRPLPETLTERSSGED